MLTIEKASAALEKWAADDLRSINSQIEYLLSDLLKKLIGLNKIFHLMKKTQGTPSDED